MSIGKKELCCFFAGAILILLAFLIAIVLAKKADPDICYIIAFTFCIIGVALFVGSGTYDQSKHLAREVDLTKVTLRGEQKFEAKIKITFKNGKLTNVELIKTTTDEVTS